MSMTPACVLLGLLAALMLISKSSASPVAQDRNLQEAIHKRIFCNFYGCGQKKSAGTEFEDDGQRDGLSDSNLANERERNYLMDLAAQNADLPSSPEREKYLRAVAMFEALRNELSVPSHRNKRNIRN